MRIISPFKDCYDSIQAFGPDDGLLYVRKTVEEDRVIHWGQKAPRNVGPYASLVDKLHDLRADAHVTEWHYEIRPKMPQIEYPPQCKFNPWEQGMLYFCGTAYPFIYTTSHNKSEYKPTIWNLAQYKKVTGEELKVKSEAFKWKRAKKDPLQTFNIPDVVKEKMIQNRVPMFLILTRKFVFNPCLHSLGFDTIVPPHQIAQELLMWFGNIASKDDTPIKISDKDRIMQHGFDKYSFRHKP